MKTLSKPVRLDFQASSTCNQIVSIAHRARKGPTGGPGGVLFVQESVLGNSIGDIDLHYEYAPKTLLPANKWLCRISSKLGLDYEDLQRIQWACSLTKKWQNARFIVHEPVSAFGLALCGARYSLIYHQQGSLAAENESFGCNLNTRQKLVLNLIEAVAFRRATKVYFPSLGAKKAYLESSKANNPNSFKSGLPLYNTILPDEEKICDDEQKILNSFETKGIVFLSVGALTWAKGIDLIPKFIKEFKKLSARDLTWIVVGVGSWESQLRAAIQEFDLEANTQLITRRLGHPAILKLMEIADCYVMLHRRAIFDFATLEAMHAGCAVVLSDIDGNPEFNINDNVLLVNHNENIAKIANRLCASDMKQLGDANREVFQSHFSPSCFKEAYSKLVLELATA